MPCSPDPLDLPVSVSSSEVISKLKREDAKAFAVLNNFEPRTNLGIAAPEMLENHLSIPLMSIYVPRRHSVKRAKPLMAGEGLGSDVKEGRFETRIGGDLMKKTNKEQKSLVLRRFLKEKLAKAAN